MKGHYTIDYQDFVQELGSVQTIDVESAKQTTHSWGSYQENNTFLGPIRMYEIRADLNKDFNIRISDEDMNNDIHVCATLQGNITGTFCKRKVKGELKDSQHHHIYAPESNYELAFKDMHVVHLAINRGYFINLIDESESWMKELRANLCNQQVVQPVSINLAPAMRNVLANLVQPSLDGNLRNLMIEAKVLELIALQLDQYRKIGVDQPQWKKKDRETFHAIREHLLKTFAEDHSLQSLSREFGINEFKLKQGFRQHFGTTVFDFIFDAKMNYAKQLILDKRMYLHEISRMIGYKNANHFSTAFKKKFGFSPNELKNN